MTRAELFHTIATELSCDPELVGDTATRLKLRKQADIEAAVRTRLSTGRVPDAVEADDAASTQGQPEATPESDAPAPKKPAKPGLTLSQRRALLRLLDGGDDGFTPTTPFKALPYEYATEVGYAVATPYEVEDDGLSTYRLTAEGRARAESINPAYRDWSAGETVAGDESRPTAGTHRAKRAAERAADEAAASIKPEKADEPTEPVELVAA